MNYNDLLTKKWVIIINPDLPVGVIENTAAVLSINLGKMIPEMVSHDDNDSAGRVAMTFVLAMFSFSLVMSITPGPVNMIILSSGISYGAKRTIPYVSGATIGFTLLLLFIGFGFSAFINTYPFLLKYLAIVGSLYIIFMGYKIAFSKPALDVNKKDTPKFYEGFLLQWINPKAWIACVSGASIFSSSENYGRFLTFSIIYFIVCYISLGIWAILGDKMSHLLKDHSRLQRFNFIMGLLLILTAAYLCFGQLNH